MTHTNSDYIVPSTRKFSMFTGRGDRSVRSIVQRSIRGRWSWAKTCKALDNLSNKDGYEEAMDTEVRGCVYDYLMAHNDNEWREANDNFYI